MHSIKNTFLFVVAVSGLFLTTSCDKNFKEINTNPNAVSNATPDALLAPALHYVVSRNMTRAHRLTHELMQVHVTVNNSDEIHRYLVRPAESDYMWNTWYLKLTDFRDMYERADFLNETSFMAIANILDVWTSSLITDTYGDVPYFNSNKGKEGIYQPEFDAQEDIYADLFRKLEDANTLLALNKTMSVDQASKDILYNGDINLWRKFGNSLYLRLLMRASGRTETDVLDRIKRVAETEKSNYPMFANIAESAVLKFTGVAPFTSGFFSYRAYDFNGENGLSQFFINNLTEWDDPRLDRFATRVGGIFQGIPSGYAVGDVPERLSAYQPALIPDPLLGNMINYAEVQFLLAEATIKGFINSDAKTHYENGVTSAITYWGIEVPAGHLQKEDILWDDNNTMDRKMAQIFTQKYYTLLFTDFQSWFEYRRTGYPELPKGEGLQNNGIMPTRLKYPVAVQTLNAANYLKASQAMGADDMLTEVWWNK